MKAKYKYLITCVVFIVGMGLKLSVDKQHWTGSIETYWASTLIIVPIIWYAGYFFKEAEEERNKPL